jgi:hypothetical protein
MFTIKMGGVFFALFLVFGNRDLELSQSVDNPNTTQTLEYTKDKYNVKII